MHFRILRQIFLIALVVSATTLSGNSQNRIRLSKPNDFIYSGIGISFFAWGTYAYDHKSDWPPSEFTLPDYHSINRFDRSAVFHYSKSAAKTSDVFLLSSLALPSVLFLDSKMRKDAGPISIVYLQTVFLTLGEIQLVKGYAHRLRPYVYNENVATEAKMNADAGASFFSGHTAMTSAMAVYTASVYSAYYHGSKAEPWIWAGALAVPLTTGYLRYRAGMHFPTDILTGFLVGAANGFLMARLHRSID
ncbi:MAG: phosphatase PAP2 family protein [Bacteroidetes bacterium]|nr:phosphatase PAP2 family protein [Bacteroidota bacterium]